MPRVNRLALLFALAPTIAAAQDLPDLVQERLSDPDFNSEPIDALIEAQRQNPGWIDYGLYTGEQFPTFDPIEVAPPAEMAYACVTTVEGPAAAQAMIPGGEDSYRIRPLPDGRKRILVAMNDRFGAMTLDLRSDGETTEIKALVIVESGEAVRFASTPDGALFIPETGETFPADSPETSLINKIVTLVAKVNPAWFVPSIRMSVGDEYYEEAFGDALNAMMEETFGTMAALQGNASAALDLDFIEFIFTGRTMHEGAEHLVFQGSARGAASTLGGPDAVVSIAMHQLFDARDFTPSLLETRVSLSEPGRPETPLVRLGMIQTCEAL